MTQAMSDSGASERTWWDRLGTAGIVGLQAGLLAAVTFAWALPQALWHQLAPSWAVAASAVLAGALLATLLANSGVMAMALQTFAQCIRMKVAVAFMVLLAGALAALPAIMVGDGTLAGAIRSLLSWGPSVVAVLLSVVTVLLSSNVVSNDIRRKQIFLTATKPLARWQYVLGRWLGVVLLDALLLALSMGTIYLLAQHLRRSPDRLVSLVAAAEDRRAVETEVFVARGVVHPAPVDIQKRAQDAIEDLQKRGTLQQAIDAYLPRYSGGRGEGRGSPQGGDRQADPGGDELLPSLRHHVLGLLGRSHRARPVRVSRRRRADPERMAHPLPRGPAVGLADDLPDARPRERR